MRVVPALDRGLEILEYLGTVDSPIRPSEIVSRLNMPRTAVYELLNTLRERGFIEQHSDGQISLGPQLFTLGSKYGEKLDSTQVAQEVALQLIREVDETAQVGVLRGRNVLYIARADPNRMVRLVSAIGRQIPAHCTAIGKVLLAELADEELAERIDGVELEALTAQSITDAGVLREDLRRIRDEGVAYDNGESNLEVSCVAVPVRNVLGECIAAISISTPAARMNPDRLEVLRRAVLAAAARISSRLGYVSDAQITN